jgi:hypothetical protein
VRRLRVTAMMAPPGMRQRPPPRRGEKVVVTPAARGTAVSGIADSGRSSVGCPIVVARGIWGVIAASTTSDRPFPPDTEAKIAGFTELVAIAVENAAAHAELTASRARIVATVDQTRRRIERDLHDGAQQRLVSLALQLRAARATVPPDLDGLVAELDGPGRPASRSRSRPPTTPCSSRSATTGWAGPASTTAAAWSACGTGWRRSAARCRWTARVARAPPYGRSFRCIPADR